MIHSLAMRGKAKIINYIKQESIETMKKNNLLTIALMASMAFSTVTTQGIVAFAEEAVPTRQTIDANSAADKNGNYTISVAESDTHTYKVYQILTGTLIAGKEKLGNPAWGADAINYGLTTDESTKALNKFIEDITKENLTNVEINDLVLAQRADNASGQGIVTKDDSLDVVPGYYLIEDITDLDEVENGKLVHGEGAAKSLNIVAVFNDITITAKKGTVVSEKHVDDQNDSNSEDHSELMDSADYDIGDSIPYTLTMKLPDDYENYKQYYVSFVDDMSAGLTYNGDAKIYYGADDKTGDDISFTADTSMTSAYTGGTVYRATIQNLKDKDATEEQKKLSAGSVITIKYTATLNSNAVIGSAGNPNQYKVDFSSNPNQAAGGTPETNDTPWDTNIVFTYKTVFNKVDADKKPLTGADFRLDKFIAGAGEDTYGTGESQVKGTWTDVTTLGTTDHPAKTVEDFTKDGNTAENAKFTFSGLDAGVYRLTETTTPAGYNTIDPIIFTITAEHELESDAPSLTSLSGTDGAEFIMTAVEKEGSLTSEIINKQGTLLPSTGGIGTTILYVIGGILVIGGGAAIFIKRKKDSE